MSLRIIKSSKVLIFFWVVAFFFVEIVQFDLYAASCITSLKDLTSGKKVKLTMGIIGDPQLTDFYSYKQRGILLLSTEFISDLYMRKNFRRMEPVMDIVFFTGDLFDGGHKATMTQFKEDLSRFQRVFRNPRSVPFLSVTGNHDVGYSANEDELIIERFEETFGATHEIITISQCTLVQSQLWMRNDSRTKKTVKYRSCEERRPSTTDMPLLTLVLLNSQYIDAPPDSVAHKESMKFVAEAVNDIEGAGAPVVLAVHMPLYRRRYDQCGSLRTSEEIPSLYEKGLDGDSPVAYQNYISKKHSEHLLHTIMPKIILSGHDHDHCKFEHNGVSTEYTIGTFSWLQGNHDPSVSFLLLDDRGGLFIKTCPLPDQYHMIYFYIVLGIFSLLTSWFTIDKKQRVSPRHGATPAARYFVTILTPRETFLQIGVVVVSALFFLFVICLVEST